jgi:hypothetical protein
MFMRGTARQIKRAGGSNRASNFKSASSGEGPAYVGLFFFGMITVGATQNPWTAIPFVVIMILAFIGSRVNAADKLKASREEADR